MTEVLDDFAKNVLNRTHNYSRLVDRKSDSSTNNNNMESISRLKTCSNDQYHFYSQTMNRFNKSGQNT